MHPNGTVLSHERLALLEPKTCKRCYRRQECAQRRKTIYPPEPSSDRHRNPPSGQGGLLSTESTTDAMDPETDARRHKNLRPAGPWL